MTPSPLTGEGWGEGDALTERFPPHPQPLSHQGRGEFSARSSSEEKRRLSIDVLTMNRNPTPPNARHPAASFHGGCMNSKRGFWILMAAVGAVVFASSVRAEDRDLAFVHALDTRGYGDVAVDFLDTMAKRPDLPASVRDVLDLEMSKAIRVQAQNANDAAERVRLLTKSQNLLEKFARTKPNHPEAVQRNSSSAEMILDEGKQSWAESRELKDPKEVAAKLLAVARRSSKPSRFSSKSAINWPRG